MSKASKTGQVIFSQKMGVIMPILMSDKGDLYQEYDGDQTDPTRVAPNFATMQPVLSFVATSSRMTEGIVKPVSIEWYFGDTLLDFQGSPTSKNTFGGETGHFEFIARNDEGTQDYFALRIKKNLVKAAGAAPCIIKAIATVKIGNNTDKIQCQYNIPITASTGTSKRVTIMAADNKFFTLRSKGDSCQIKAIARLGADEITAGLTYKWFQLENTAWKELVETQQTLTVTDVMVSTAGQFKVEVYQGGTLIGMDVQTVIDASDPLDILLNPVPEDETISEVDDVVVYTPKLVQRGTNTEYKKPGTSESYKFFFVFMDGAGVLLNKETSAVASASGTCTYDMCIQAGGNVNYTITTEE